MLSSFPKKYIERELGKSITYRHKLDAFGIPKSRYKVPKFGAFHYPMLDRNN